MATLKSFVAQNPDLTTSSASSEPANKELVIRAAVLAVSDDRIEILHEGARFTVSPNDVIDIEPMDKTGVTEGKPAVIKLKGDAILMAINAVPASQFASGVPFAFRSQGPMTPMLPSSAEEAWRQRVGYTLSPVVAPMPGLEANLAAATGSQSTCYWCYSDQNCGWIYDDTKADD